MIYHFLITNEKGDILYNKFFTGVDSESQEEWLKHLFLKTEMEWNIANKGHRVATHK